jgi:hypothetical protein
MVESCNRVVPPAFLSWSTLRDALAMAAIDAVAQDGREPCTEYCPLGERNRFVRYRSAVTVPGKGGRPRKWRSDADRVRAFRARRRGEAEPSTFEVALLDGDELAHAVDLARRLQSELSSATESLAASDAELHAERRRHAATQRRLDRTRATLDELRAANELRSEELHIAREEEQVDALAEISRLRTEPARPLAVPEYGGSNRAARRRAAKRDRRSQR